MSMKNFERRLRAPLAVVIAALLAAAGLEATATMTCTNPNSEAPPALHYVPTAAALQAAQEASDAIQPINGKIGIVGGIGMSITKDMMTFVRGLAGTKIVNGGWKEYLNPAVKIVDCAQSGMTAAYWDEINDEKWGQCLTKIANAGLTPDQVQVLWVVLTEVHSVDPITGSAMSPAQIHGVVAAAKHWLPNLKKVSLSGASTMLFDAPIWHADGTRLTWAERDAYAKVLEPAAGLDHWMIKEQVEAGGWPVMSVELMELGTRGSEVNPFLEARTPSGFLLAPAFGASCYPFVDRYGVQRASFFDSDGLHPSPASQRDYMAPSYLGRQLLTQPYLRRNATPLP